MVALPYKLVFRFCMKGKQSWLLSAFTLGFSLLSVGVDYVAQPSGSFFAFSSSTTDVRMCTTVTLIDDDSVENDVENFFANLALASTAPRVRINPSQAEIQINDEDSTF